MKRISKARQKELDGLRKDLSDAFDEVYSAVNAANDKISHYNYVVQQLIDVRDQIAGDMRCYYDERSERWQESDAGVEYEQWVSEWEEAEVEEMDGIDEPCEADPEPLADLRDEP